MSCGASLRLQGNMFTKIVAPLLGFGICCTTLLSQQVPSPSTLPVVREFPVILQQNVIAGTTGVGTKIQAKLAIATLVDSAVIPRNAVFSGEVIESAAKTATEPSRLAIRMDSEQWKNGSASIKVYLTAWYYPVVAQTGQDLQYGPTLPANRTWNGQGQYPDPRSTDYKPFPGRDSDKGAAPPDTPASITSNHRVPMKNVESGHNNDGAITLVSRHSNLKLDKITTYVLSTGDLLPPPAK